MPVQKERAESTWLSALAPEFVGARDENNGNMTTRTVSGSTYTLGYDYENRLTLVSGAATDTFTFDGDGNRVKSVVGSTTTLFVGSHYESTGSVVTKYYLAGGSWDLVASGGAGLSAGLHPASMGLHAGGGGEG